MNQRDIERAWEAGKVRDWSAEERYVNRSIRIRKHVLRWLGQHVGFHYTDMMKMAEECANEFKPTPFASITAYRWLQQFSRVNAPFRIRTDENDWYVICDRKSDLSLDPESGPQDVTGGKP